MRLVRRLLPLSAVTAALLVSASCSSDGAAGAQGGAANIALANPDIAWTDGDPVHGNVLVMWRNLDPRNPASAVGIVNETSQNGQKLKSGKSTSSEIRVLNDSDMGGLLASLRKIGFFDHATDGLGLSSIPDVPGKKGIIIVTQDGHDKGLMLTTNLGKSAIPQTYIEAKNLIFTIHSNLPGFDVKASVGEPDERVFSVPPPKLKR